MVLLFLRCLFMESLTLIIAARHLLNRKDDSGSHLKLETARTGVKRAQQILAYIRSLLMVHAAIRAFFQDPIQNTSTPIPAIRLESQGMGVSPSRAQNIKIKIIQISSFIICRKTNGSKSRIQRSVKGIWGKESDLFTCAGIL